MATKQEQRPAFPGPAEVPTGEKQRPSSPKLTGNLKKWFRDEEENLKTWTLIALTVLTISAIVGLVMVGYLLGWTGFQGKTLWDWIGLFSISTVLAALGYWFARRQALHAEQQRKQADRLAQEQQAHDKALAEDQEQAAILETYLDKMTELLLKEHLGERTEDGQLKPEYEQVRKVARTRTLTSIRRLKGKHISTLFTFLQDANLNGAHIQPAIIDFQNADLRRIDLYEVELREVDLSGANLRRAKLSGAKLSGADLRGADLRGADLSNAILSPHFRDSGEMVSTDLSGASLFRADLSGAKLSGAILRGARGIIPEKLVRQAGTLKGTTMPDGTLYQPASATDSAEVKQEGASVSNA